MPLLQSLTNGLDVPTLDGFIERLFALAGDLECVTCRLGQQGLRIDSKDRILHESEFSRSKSTLRIVCARLTVLCEKWTNGGVNPYGDNLTLQIRNEKNTYLVTFENTPSQQWIKIALAQNNL